jgi:hypothetical protein
LGAGEACQAPTPYARRIGTGASPAQQKRFQAIRRTIGPRQPACPAPRTDPNPSRATRRFTGQLSLPRLRPRACAAWASSKPATRNGLSLPRSGCPFGPPLRDQRSRPASSPPCRMRRFPSASASLPVSGDLFRATVCRRASDSPDVASLLCSPLGPLIPPDRSSSRFAVKKLAFERTARSCPSP